MKGYQIHAAIHSSSRVGQRKLQKMIKELIKIYTSPSRFSGNIRIKTFNNGLTKGIHLKLFCYNLKNARIQIQFLNCNILDLLEDFETETFIPSIKIIITRKLFKCF